jgi:hypothetical protein
MYVCIEEADWAVVVAVARVLLHFCLKYKKITFFFGLFVVVVVF